jgi:hypothetical protein
MIDIIVLLGIDKDEVKRSGKTRYGRPRVADHDPCDSV